MKKKVVRKLYNETSKFYEERYYDLQFGKYQSVRIHLLKYFKHFLNYARVQRLYLVDVGCGTGLFFSFLMKDIFRSIHARETLSRFKYICIELSEEMLRIALKKEHFLLHYHILANAEAIPLKDNISMITVSFTVLQNLDDPLTFIKELIRITDSNGILIVSALKKNLSEDFFRKNVVNRYHSIISSFEILSFGEEDIGIVLKLSKF